MTLQNPISLQAKTRPIALKPHKLGPTSLRFNLKNLLPLAVLAAAFPCAAEAGMRALPDPLKPSQYHAADPAQAELGQLLFYDKILSGNRNISCGTCHHHRFGSADGLSLGIGEGGKGVGPDRTAGTGDDRIKQRVPRNAPGLWNLGHKSVRVLFHDGRISNNPVYGNGYKSPAKKHLPQGLSSVLAAQALFPMTSDAEMAGTPDENEVAAAVHDRIDKGWPILTARVAQNETYAQMFSAAFSDVDAPEDITIVHVAEALSAFMNAEWRSGTSDFDRYLAGDAAAMSTEAQKGMQLFYGKARCNDCHTGQLFTDDEFHALAIPPIGPGRPLPNDRVARDNGRMEQTRRIEDAYRFRTPPLRNVAVTGPYGHNGAFPTLEAMIRHHCDPDKSLASWTTEQAGLPEVPWLAKADFVTLQDKIETARQRRHVDILDRPLEDNEIEAIVAFLESLTDSRTRPMGVPKRVPSGLPVDQ
ncbi:cytochrome c peroxidase [Donghicola tyrosinivorans]|uniref:Cytochrome c peroxidase n=2 Tax=Donghicola tyrosinivorans TaxID=1652492 RepID=A0A2T0WGH3_9RHOB|nr:cytochrome c peroxidase [Donghicola tyrosinivorans]